MTQFLEGHTPPPFNKGGGGNSNYASFSMLGLAKTLTLVSFQLFLAATFLIELFNMNQNSIMSENLNQF